MHFIKKYYRIPTIILALIGAYILGQRAPKASYTGEIIPRKEAFSLYTLKSEADELFIDKKYQEAFEIYNKLTKKTGDSTLLQKREISRKENAFVKKELLTLLKNCPESLKKYGAKSPEELQQEDLLDCTVDCFKDVKQTASYSKERLKEIDGKTLLQFKSSGGNKVYYLGYILDSLASGMGTGIFETGSIYEGEWKNNQRHGKGFQKFKNGEVYEGDWRNDKREGSGIYTFRNGDYYKGEWKANKRDGFGTVVSARGDTLVHGYWKEDSFDRRKTRKMKVEQ
ncbi:hypothetical protein RCC89_20620 [Cytophagaceae bacterium ABcell3]|nr:hypothetical protein RCC89_20620 [Cytophagaceae bacterium ABcell3]